MKTELYNFTDGGFMVICRESSNHGFTNHRLEFHPKDGHWVMEPIAAFQPQEVLKDVSAIIARCKIISASANPYLAEAANAVIHVAVNEYDCHQ